jgi:PKD repeat protein
VSFDGTTSRDPDGTVTDWSWDFGDGSTGSGSRTAHTYTEPGRYFPKLTVTDNSGAQAVFVGEVVIDPGSPPAVSSGGATAIASTSATLNGSVNPQGQATTYRFEYGTTTGYGSATSNQTVSASDSTSHAVSADVSGLAPGSLEGWFKWQGGVALMRDGSSATGAGWILAYDIGGSLYYRLGGTSFSTGIPTASVRDGWHYFVATKDGPNVAFYLDGQLKHGATGAGNAPPTMP